MNHASTRLVQPQDLPESLWNRSEELLHLPPDLITAYATILERHNLRALANEEDRDSPVGGVSQAETDAHLAKAFGGSAARVELAILDPKNLAPHVADAFARILSGNRVAVADVPCGSGAAILTMLTCVAELRRQGCVPREPLDVVLIAGEISDFARTYAAEGMREIEAALASQAITVEPCFVSWDVLDELSTTDLIREIITRGQQCGPRMVIVANFSGFLQRGGKWKEAQPQLEELFRYARGPGSCAIWIEPSMNAVTDEGGMFRRLTALANEKWSRFVQVFGFGAPDKPDYVATAECRVQHPLHRSRQFQTRLAVLRCDLRDRE